ncbi:ABC transporter permease [Risungbinella massiliensis]|uniref:ABC transporter permease n=1 Tax=Risungbinella massiliensis TaxID=1329796 RepID=UPI00069CA3C3|nr:ABC-2 family transporter protein [Risungbinella massiliensis]
MRLALRLFRASFYHLRLAKAQLILRMFSQMFLMFLEFAVLFLILIRFREIGGWNIYEVAVLYGISSGTIALSRMIFSELHYFDRILLSGGLDSYLIRPVSPLFLLMVKQIAWSKMGGILQALLVLGFGLSGLSSVSLVPLFLYLPILTINSLLIMFFIELTSATITFWTGRNKELQPFLVYAPSTGALYPQHIYPDWLQGIFLTLLPIGWLNYFPLSFLLNKSSASVWLWVTPCIAIFFAGIAIGFWKKGLARYSSTGS